MRVDLTSPLPRRVASLLYALALAIVALFACSSCTTVYERGHKLAVIGSNVTAFHLVTPAGTHLDIATVDNAAIHKAAGAAVSNAALSAGTAVATSGLFPKGF